MGFIVFFEVFCLKKNMWVFLGRFFTTTLSCGCNSPIYVSKNEAVCCEVQTHFGSFRLACF